MIEARFELTLLLMVIWPLLLVAGLVFTASRGMVLKLVPWAALPVLAMTIAMVHTSYELQLSFLMLGSGLEFDATARVFLILNAALWLATGVLARSKLREAGAERFAVVLLLAMAGSFCLALAADAVLFFAAATLTAYALYAMLAYQADASAQLANRVLLILLVVSDLLVFELLLLLGHSAASVDFASLRQALVKLDNHGLVLALLLSGFGIKLGVLGVHFWLKPVFVSASPALRPALIGFMLSAGLLGWLRLLPAGELFLLDMSPGLQWLAWVTLVYAVVLGMLHSHYRALIACAAITLTAMWLVILGAPHPSPQDSYAIDATMPGAVLQTGFAITALLLLNGVSGLAASVPGRLVLPAVRWLAVLSLVTAPVIIARSVFEIHSDPVFLLDCIAAVMAFLSVRGVLLDRATHDADHGMPVTHTPAAQAVTLEALLVATGLTLAALLAAALNLNLNLNIQAVAEFLQPLLLITLAVFAAWLSVACFVVPGSFARGVLLTICGKGVARLFARINVLANVRLVFYRDALRALAKEYYTQLDWRQLLGSIETRIASWQTALIILTLLGLFMAVMNARG